MTTIFTSSMDPNDPGEMQPGITAVVLPDGTTTKIYTRSNVCDALGMNHSTLARWEQKGLIEPAQRINGMCVYTEQMFEKIKTVWENSSRNVAPEELCQNCKTRKARRGSTLCSRCSYSSVEHNLRSTLPGMVQDEPRTGSTAVDGSNDLPLPPEGDEVEACPKCGSDDPFVRNQLRSGPDDFPIVLDCDNDWHQKNINLQTGITYAQLHAFLPGFSYYTRRQVCDLVGISLTTISRWEAKKNTPLPFQLINTRQLYYTEEHIRQIKEYAAVAQQLRTASPIVQAAKSISSKTFSRASEKAVAIKLRGVNFRKGGLL